MVIFSTQNTAQNNSATTQSSGSADLGVNLSLAGIPADIKTLLVAVGGDIPAGQTGDASRPRYNLLKGKVAKYAGFYLDADGVIKYDSTTDNANNPDFVATATYVVTNAGVNNNKFTLKVTVSNKTVQIAEVKVKTGDTINSIGTKLRDAINSSTWSHGYWASGTNQNVTVSASEFSGAAGSTFSLTAQVTGSAAGTVTQFTSTASTTSQPHRSIDKLTFYIMFRLPFRDTAYNTYYGDPLSTTNTTSWTYQANQLRLTYGLRKLNSAGEQVSQFGAVWKPVNDAGEDLEYFTNQKGYTHAGLNVNEIFLDSLASTAATLNIDSPSEERTKLFNHTDSTQPKANYNKIPPSFLTVSLIENPYQSKYWLNSDKSSSKYSRGPHIPMNAPTEGNKKKVRKFIRFTTDPGTADLNGLTIKKETAGTSHYVEIGTTKYYLQIAAGEQLSSKIEVDDYTFLNLTLAGAKVIKDGTRYLAEFNVVDDAVVSNNNSGLTEGMGMDIGNVFHGLFDIKFDITLNTAATGKFRLYYADRVSSELEYTISKSGLKDAIYSIMFPSFLSNLNSDQKTAIKNLINVGNPVTTGTNKKFSVTILRQLQAPYSHPIYSCTDDLSAANSNVVFNPAQDKDRWKINSTYEKDDWYTFTRVINYCFSNSPKTAGVYDPDFWLKQNGMTAAEQSLVKKIIRFSMGVMRGKSYIIYSETGNNTVLKKLEFKSYVQGVRGAYNELYIANFYNSSRTNQDNVTLSNPLSVQVQVMNNLTGLPQPNQAEHHLMANMIYNAPGTLKSNSKNVVKSIKRHSLAELRKLVPKVREDRRDPAYRFIASQAMIKNLYRGMYD